MEYQMAREEVAHKNRRVNKLKISSYSLTWLSLAGISQFAARHRQIREKEKTFFHKNFLLFI